jgi:hypothetical protein
MADTESILPSSASDSAEKVRKVLAGYSGLYAPSIITEAAALLDAYLDTAEQCGLDRAAANFDGWLTLAAAESVSRQYGGRPKQERTSAQLHSLVGELRTALAAEGLEIVPTPVRMGIGVAPLPGGPTWGMGRGLAVAMYVDSGWELMANSEQTRVHAIHAPATVAGAAEVAHLVHGVLQGTEPDPFRRNR